MPRAWRSVRSLQLNVQKKTGKKNKVRKWETERKMRMKSSTGAQKSRVNMGHPPTLTFVARAVFLKNLVPLIHSFANFWASFPKEINLRLSLALEKRPFGCRARKRKRKKCVSPFISTKWLFFASLFLRSLTTLNSKPPPLFVMVFANVASIFCVRFCHRRVQPCCCLSSHPL